MALQLIVTNFIRTFLTPFEENSNKNDYFEEDCISQLPDEILASILSYLTVKDAVKTRLLSRKWRHLYLWYLHASRSELNFDCESAGFCYTKSHQCQQYTCAFVQWVNKFLNQYKGPNISSFRVAFCLGWKFASDIDRWITFAVKLGVEQLKIICSCYGISYRKQHELYAFSFQHLSDASELKHLELNSCILKQDFNGQLHSLKFLDLISTPLDQSILLFILSRCCNLERLRMAWCLCPPVLSFYGPFLQLKMLTVSFCKGLEEIELSATNLTTLEVFVDRMNFNIVFSDVPNLQNVLCQKPCKSSFPGDLFNKFENAVPQLQSLIVSSTTTLLKYIPSRIATIGNLKQLEFIFYSGIEPYNIWKIIHVLIACPLLQIFNLTIKPGIHLYDAFDIEERTMKEIQKYHYPRLKEVEIGGFQGTETQLALALYLLKNAVQLERMVITSCFWKYLTSGKRTYHELLPWTDGMHKNIIEQLQGKATSKIARLIIYKGLPRQSKVHE